MKLLKLMKLELGVIGLGTMGANLARNAARNGATVAVFNRTTEKTDAFMKKFGKEGKFIPCKTLKELCAALQPPRPVLLMVKAGDAVDAMIAELLPQLSKGDIIIDAGNSHYRDTARREKELRSRGMHFIGMGVSGGEKGALEGPSMMPGGDKKAIESLMPLFKKMSADDGSTPLTTGGEGEKCVTHVGPGGSGHFVKMVHNGIEYGLMQLLAEAYALLKLEGKLSNEKIADLFSAWNKGEDLQSFLVEITADIFRKKDDVSKGDLIDVIKDSAGQKGTGKWTTDAAMHYGVAVPTITAAIDARIASSAKDFRVIRSKEMPAEIPEIPENSGLPADLRSAMELSFIVTYAQGFQLIEAASKEEGWGTATAEVVRIWRGGCIIRAAMLAKFQKMLSGDREAALERRGRFGEGRQLQWRNVISRAVLRGIPVPALSASLAYFDAYRTERLPQNLIQAQRDYFGAHEYERLDKPGSFHTEWIS